MLQIVPITTCANSLKIPSSSTVYDCIPLHASAAYREDLIGMGLTLWVHHDQHRCARTLSANVCVAEGSTHHHCMATCMHAHAIPLSTQWWATVHFRLPRSAPVRAQLAAHRSVRFQRGTPQTNSTGRHICKPAQNNTAVTANLFATQNPTC